MKIFHSIRPQAVRTWYRIHKWSSLICTAFLLIACITGLPLVFMDELIDLTQPHEHPVATPAGASLVSLDQLVRQTETLYPSLHAYAVALDDDEPRVFVTMTATPNPKSAADLHAVVYDAHTGKQLKQPQFGGSFLDAVFRLHRELFLGLSGELLMGAMSLSFVLSLISGALVYGPFMRRLDFGTYRSQAAARVRWFDLHNLLGIVTLSWALVIGLTGVMNALATPLFGLWRAQTMPALLAPYRGQPVPQRFASIDQAMASAAKALPYMETTSVLFPNAVVGSSRHYIVWTRGKTPMTSRLFTPVLVDASTGQVTVAKALPWYLRLLEVCRPLHFGDYGGLPLKILWALFDVAIIMVLGSGLYLWVSRRRTPIEKELDRLVALKEEESQGV
ncbi:MAG: PepSY-associated TM helix domain-containing protein [Edaphobacter sp.]|uniref:PepSY-associated TM helix domain-containing protein n=1 Tax=Edaphobacter sp. TaxID=1934404 RepID=UPI0023827181|nr:PepSY-associated TM helix domain-containing protein [Edaphobacter sp.]MDE1175839.1 PepSY-associated TM helix domain-containing protein [Edaphobacter sp.]